MRESAPGIGSSPIFNRRLLLDLPAVLVSDFHLVEKNLEQFRVCCRQLKSQRVKTLIFLGDIFDSPDSVKWICLLDFLEFLEDLSLDVFLLTGNHDRPLFGQNVSTLKLFNRYGSVINSPVEFDGCLWLPYTEISEVSKAIEASTARICFAHLMIKGVNLNESTITTQGIERKEFKKFEFTFNGHIHQPQVDNNLFILGSPWQHSFAEAGQQKYLWIWDGQRVMPIKSDVEPRYLIDTFENLKTQDVSRKFVKVLLKPGDDPQFIAGFLEVKGARRWILQQFKAEDLTKTQAERNLVGVGLDTMLKDFADARELSLDETELGLHFLEGR